ncbi:unnamed protein product [Commensalibacter communis]|uniref:hypothetical protein n=1 Tax=Commensalibacter communis TaxID=2972786 RepID=UPI0022FF85E5|nr:hypothetical protein [Commensalibacter communis]CAI3928171.1 unnamed protein product [Commensalibacter communis]CAI3931030.1 unnamed protein product [Commensalibacter communis]
MIKYRYIRPHKYVLLSVLFCSGILPSVALSIEQQASSDVMEMESGKQPLLPPQFVITSLESNRANQKQTQTYSPLSDVNHKQDDVDHTMKLSKSQLGRIAGSVRRCYTQDTAARNYANNIVHMIVTVDNTGMARIVDFDASTKARMSSDPAYSVFAERAKDAVLSPKCSKLPIPSNMLLGHRNIIQFIFKP